MPGLRVVGVVDEGHLDAQSRQGELEQGEGATVQARGGDDVVTGAGEVENRRRDRGHPRGERHGAAIALQGRHSLLEGGDGGVVETRVDRAVFLQAESLRGVLAGVKDVGGRVVDRHVPGTCCIDGLTRMNGAGAEGPPVDLGIVVTVRHINVHFPSRA